MRSSVVLPQPEGPRIVTNSPADTVSDTPSRAVTGPKRLMTPRVESSNPAASPTPRSTASAVPSPADRSSSGRTVEAADWVCVLSNSGSTPL